MSKRVFLIVLDSCGVGMLPDASEFGDYDCNTLKRISASPEFSAENMLKMGIGNIVGCDYLKSTGKPLAAVGKCAELSRGKDTTTGHWEISGVISKKPMPTYPDGFPKAIIDEFSEKTGRGVLCNKPYSGTQVIKDYGDEHIKTGKLIVYTSADSVFQIAADEEVVPLEALYEYCKIARKILCGKNAVGRVIARPFVKKDGEFIRTANRHDFSLEPPKPTLLDMLSSNGKAVYAIGKIYDIFASRGITEHVFTHSNKEGMERTLEAVSMDFEGFCFTNLVDFDMLYGHRQDIDGYARAFSEFDKWLPSFTEKMRDDDILIITADHGCDPGDNSTDHTREYIPLVVYGKKIKPENLGIRKTYADISASIAEYFGIDYSGAGESFFSNVKK